MKIKSFFCNLIYFFLISNFNLLTVNNNCINYFKNLFPQVQQHSTFYIKKAQKFIKNIDCYNGFNWIASFSALLLNPEFKAIYLDYYSEINYLTSSESKIYKNKFLYDNENYMTFYVLASEPSNKYTSNYSLFNGFYSVNKSILSKNTNSSWKVYLNFEDSEILYPVENIKSIELENEYKFLFGDFYNQFKSVYELRFALKDKNNKFLSGNLYKKINLIFTSSQYYLKLSWDKF